jgi:DNA-binding transcriptional ArsR family regulator
MSPRTPNRTTQPRAAARGKSRARAPQAAPARRSETRTAATLAALGDRTRLSLLARLGRGGPCSISQLTHGSHLTRQAITKHLRVLERAKIVRSVRSGRHSLFELDPRPVHDLRDYLDRVSAEWDNALLRLKSFVES